MHKIKNLTNSPHHIQLADGSKGRLPARGEDEFEVDPKMLQFYERCGFLKLEQAGGEDRGNQDPPQQDAPDHDADADADAASHDDKDDLIAKLAELGIKKDRRSSVESLQTALEEAQQAGK